MALWLVATDSVSAAHITAGRLKFKPVANANGSGYDSFTFQVNDGVIDSFDPGTFIIVVSNQMPVALASSGAFIAMLATVLINAWLQVDFAREWTDSLRIKSREPLGETAIMRMLRGKRKQGTDEQETSKRN